MDRITPNILFTWFIGDGSNNKGEIELETQSFLREDTIYLILLLQRVGLNGKLYKSFDKRNDTTYWSIRFNRSEYQKFMNYLTLADPQMVDIGKRFFPWKFDKNLSFKAWKKTYS